MSAIQPDPSDKSTASQAKDLLVALLLLALVAAAVGGLASAGTDAVYHRR